MLLQLNIDDHQGWVYLFMTERKFATFNPSFLNRTGEGGLITLHGEEGWDELAWGSMDIAI